MKVLVTFEAPNGHGYGSAFIQAAEDTFGMAYDTADNLFWHARDRDENFSMLMQREQLNEFMANLFKEMSVQIANTSWLADLNVTCTPPVRVVSVEEYSAPKFVDVSEMTGNVHKIAPTIAALVFRKDQDSNLKIRSFVARFPKVREWIEAGQKINAIKELRSATGLGLKDAKDLTERYGSLIGADGYSQYN